MARPKHTRRDANQAQLVEELRDLGAVVWDTADLGGRVLDLVVAWRGVMRPVEVKAAGSEQYLTDGERESIEELRYAGVEAIIATCAEDVISNW